jgi:hypothetical protein
MIELTSTTILTFSTVVLAISTVVLTIFTWNLVNESKENRKYQKRINEPELSIICYPSKKSINNIFISIKNIGKSPIYNLKLENVEGDDFETIMEENISETNFLNKQNYLRPEQEIKNLLIQIWGDDKEFKIFNLKYSYNDNKNKKYIRNFKFDFNDFKGLISSSDDISSEKIKILKNISKNINKIAMKK